MFQRVRITTTVQNVTKSRKLYDTMAGTLLAGAFLPLVS